MKRLTSIFAIAIFIIMVIGVTPTQEAKAVIPIAKIIKEAVKKVIKAFDLMIQRLQTKTIWLQNAQKVLENKLSALKLKEIAQWSEKHRQLYKQYYDELWEIKKALATYQQIKQVIEKQKRIVKEYKRAWTMISADDHFTEAEIDYMYRIYKGIIRESIQSLDQLLSVVNSYKTKMSDAQRLAIIKQAGDGIEQNLVDLLEFNMNTYQLSIGRAKSQSEVDRIKKMYGFEN